MTIRVKLPTTKRTRTFTGNEMTKVDFAGPAAS